MDLTVMRAMTTKTTIAVAVFATIMWLSMILPNNIPVWAEDDGEISDGSGGDESSDQSGDSSDSGDSGTTENSSSDEGTTEDDGYIIGDDDSQGEVSSQDELEQTYKDTPWENNVGPNDFEEAKQHDEESAQVVPPIQVVPPKLPTCKLGVVQDCQSPYGMKCVVGTTDDPCQDMWFGMTGTPERGPDGKLINKPSVLPYCDKPHSGSCWDRKDYDQTTGLYPCNDGTNNVNWKNCKDATATKNSNNGNGGSSSSPPQPTHNCDTWSHTLDLKLAAQNATSDLIDTETARLSTMYDKAITPEQIDSYNAQVAAQNARVDKYNIDRVPLDAEVARWNAECAA
jgi:hypothetical protein